MRLRDAIKQSCDVFFYETARRLGIDRLAAMARRSASAALLGIDLPGERPGLIPTREWKLATTGERLEQGETLIAGIGQGSVLATPLQLAMMAARLVDRPRRRAAAGARDGLMPPGGDPRLPISRRSASTRAHLALVLDGMNAVVNEQGGTAYAARIREPGWRWAARPAPRRCAASASTSATPASARPAQVPWKQRDHALFVAYAPVGAPRYVCAMVVEHGGRAAAAARPSRRRSAATSCSRRSGATRRGGLPVRRRCAPARSRYPAAEARWPV